MPIYIFLHKNNFLTRATSYNCEKEQLIVSVAYKLCMPETLANCRPFMFVLYIFLIAVALAKNVQYVHREEIITVLIHDFLFLYWFFFSCKFIVSDEIVFEVMIVLIKTSLQNKSIVFVNVWIYIYLRKFYKITDRSKKIMHAQPNFLFKLCFSIYWTQLKFQISKVRYIYIHKVKIGLLKHETQTFTKACTEKIFQFQKLRSVFSKLDVFVFF